MAWQADRFKILLLSAAHIFAGFPFDETEG